MLLVVLALAAAVAVLTATATALSVWLCLRHPYCLAAVGATAVAGSVGGPLAVAVLWTLLAAGSLVWRAQRRASFDRWVLRRWRRTVVYGWRWRRAMTACDLDRPGRGWRRVPRLGNVWSTRWTDTVTVHPLDGQDARCFGARADELARAFGALSCHVSGDAAGVVRLELRRGDPLRRPLPALPIADRTDPDALPVGIREDGAPWTVRLGDGHLLVVGGAGSGKGTVVWSLIRALAVPVRDGSVELWGVDGSGGLGLEVGEAMFARLALDGPADGAAVLDAATALVRERARRRRSRGPWHGPPAEPLVVVVVDEVVRWGPVLDDDLRRRLGGALELLLAHGRAAGVVVVATVPMADAAVVALFPQSVTLCPAGPRQACLPGVGYATSGREAPVRVRAAFVSDDEIAAMADRFSSPVHGRGPISYPDVRLSLDA